MEQPRQQEAWPRAGTGEVGEAGDSGEEGGPAAGAGAWRAVGDKGPDGHQLTLFSFHFHSTSFVHITSVVA